MSSRINVLALAFALRWKQFFFRCVIRFEFNELEKKKKTSNNNKNWMNRNWKTLPWSGTVAPNETTEHAVLLSVKQFSKAIISSPAQILWKRPMIVVCGRRGTRWQYEIFEQSRRNARRWFVAVGSLAVCGDVYALRFVSPQLATPRHATFRTEVRIIKIPNVENVRMGISTGIFVRMPHGRTQLWKKIQMSFDAPFGISKRKHLSKLENPMRINWRTVWVTGTFHSGR